MNAMTLASIIIAAATHITAANQSVDIAARVRQLATIAERIPPPESELQILEEGLSDADSRVRFAAASALSTLIMKAHGANLGPVSARPILRQNLVRLLTDSDFRIRGASVRALDYLGHARPGDVLGALISAVASEPEPSVRALIVNAVGKQSHLRAAADTVLSALTDPSDLVRAAAARSIAVRPLAEALPLIVRELQTGNEITRSDFVMALASFRAKAKPHLHVLDTLLKVELRQDRAAQIRRAMAVVERSE